MMVEDRVASLSECVLDIGNDPETWSKSKEISIVQKNQ